MDLPQTVLKQLASQYADAPKPNQPHIANANQILGQCIDQIARPLDDTVTSIGRTLDNLSSSTYTTMKTQSNNATFHATIRQIYADSRILWAILHLVLAPDDSDETVWIQCIQKLDSALVFSGAPGRMETIQALIRHIQTYKLPSSAKTSLEASNLASEIAQISLPPCGKEVTRMDEPDLVAFLTVHCKHPFVIPNSVSHWPALNDHPWSSDAYLQSVAGRGRLVPVEIGKDYRVDSWGQEMMNWEEFLTRVRDASHPLVYLAQHSLLSQFPELRDDILIPDLVYSSPTSDHPKYSPPINEEGLIINAWFGPSGTVSPAHQDPYFNCYTQVVGRKTVWLAPPNLVKEMYPLSSGIGLSNTTSLDVFSTEQDEYPLFVSSALPQSMAITLQPGDLLFFPPGWWHAMRSEDKSFSISFWF